VSCAPATPAALPSLRLEEWGFAASLGEQLVELGTSADPPVDLAEAEVEVFGPLTEAALESGFTLQPDTESNDAGDDSWVPAPTLRRSTHRAPRPHRAAALPLGAHERLLAGYAEAPAASPPASFDACVSGSRIGPPAAAGAAAKAPRTDRVEAGDTTAAPSAARVDGTDGAGKGADVPAASAPHEWALLPLGAAPIGASAAPRAHPAPRQSRRGEESPQLGATPPKRPADAGAAQSGTV
jgi:hypothetical protein